MPLLSSQDEPFELLDRRQIGRRGEIDLNQVSLRLADRREVVVGGEGGAHLGGAHIEGGHAIGLQPGPKANVRPPRISARCTPSIAVRRGWTTRIR